MTIKLKVDLDSFDDAVQQQLMGTVRDLLADPWSYDHNYKTTLDTVDGFLVVVDWYSRPSEMKEFKELIQEEYDTLVNLAFPPVEGPFDIKVTNIRELPDGSASVEYEASPKMKEFLMGVGLNKILEDSLKPEEGPKVTITYPETPDFSWEYWND